MLGGNERGIDSPLKALYIHGGVKIHTGYLRLRVIDATIMA